MLGFGSMLLTALAFVGLIVHAVRREVRAIVGSTALFLGSLMLLLWVTFSVELVGTKWPYATVYSSKRSVYYVLCDALVPTDTVFEVAQTPTLWYPLWRRAFDSAILDYSEDGSLISNPRLILSGDESILVVSRGGELTDAVDLDSSQNLVEMVGWSQPDRERAWRERTSRVTEILRSHGDSRR